MVCKHVEITGVVQGVGFRYWAVRNAQSLGLRGYVRNMPDGSVELLLCGSAEDVSNMLKQCHHGPGSAMVTGVEASEASPDTIPEGFSVRF